MKDFKKLLGSRIRHARERLRFSQKDLAEKMGIPAHKIISQIETGERNVKAWELSKLADILKVNISDLLTPDRPEISPVVLWRDLPEKDKEMLEVSFLKKCREYHNLEKAASARKYSKLPVISVDIENMALLT